MWATVLSRDVLPIFVAVSWKRAAEVARQPEGSVRLHLSGVDVGELCKRIGGAGFRAKHVLLKLPPNYDVFFLKETLSIHAVRVDQSFRKMILAVVSFRRGVDDAPGVRG